MYLQLLELLTGTLIATLPHPMRAEIYIYFVTFARVKSLINGVSVPGAPPIDRLLMDLLQELLQSY